MYILTQWFQKTCKHMARWIDPAKYLNENRRPNQYDITNLQFPWIPNFKQKIKTITKSFSEILLICYFCALWVCPDINDNTQLKWLN